MDVLQYRAGAKALATLRTQALTPELVHAMFLPAVGPRWLVWAGVDHALIQRSWLSTPARRCLLFGASIGCWRALTFAARDPAAAHAALVERYIGQHFTFDDDPKTISRSYEELLSKVFSDDDLRHALEHPGFDLAFVAARARHPGATGPRWLRAGMLGTATLLNALHPKLRALFFERTIFESRALGNGAHAHPMLAALCGKHCELTRENVRAVALASGTVPLYMEPVRHLAPAPAGAYLDGSITDYHVNQRVTGTGGIALCFLHQSKIVPGWLDKFLPWRHARAADLADVLLVYPDREFVRSLPHATIPSRDDFERYVDRPEERFAHWNEVVVRARELGEAFMRDAASGAIAARVQPL